MHFTVIFILALLTPTLTVGQNIIWDPDRKLNWEDFQGMADTSSKFDALTQSGVQYSYRWQSSNHKITYTFEVNAYYDKSKSWVKNSKATSTLLAHEQLHFDISELFARKLKQSMENTTFSVSHEAEIEKLVLASQSAREDMQLQYDTETEHMANAEQQLKWERFIANELEALKKYANVEVVN